MVTILCWTFHLGPHSLACAVEAASKSSYEVCVLPHWNIELATVEHFSDAGEALRRHAQIALRLRQAGWTTEHGSTDRRSSPPQEQARRQGAAA